MFANYRKRFSITSYGGVAISYVSGFEQVITNGIPTYYVVDFWDQLVIQFDQYWNYVKYNQLPYTYIRNIKYVNGSFYISALSYFLKTDMNFTVINYYYRNMVYHESIYYDSSSSLIYVATYGGISSIVVILDTNCRFQRYMTLGGFSPKYSLSYFNGYLYGDNGLYNNGGKSIVVASKANGTFVAQYNNVCEDGIVSINIDSFGYMAVGCWGGVPISLYNANDGTYLNQLVPSHAPLFTAVDASGRFVSMSTKAIDIYY